MKYIFASDIHGNIEILEKVVSLLDKEQADKLVLLGDTSASNTYDNERIAEILNSIKSKLEVIIGNCDNILLEDKLELPMYDIDNLYIGKNIVTITHGHRYNMYDLPPFCGNIFVQGHTHIPILKKENGLIIANPGSPTRPRGSNLRCYLSITEDEVVLKTFYGNKVKEILI